MPASLHSSSCSASSCALRHTIFTSFVLPSLARFPIVLAASYPLITGMFASITMRSRDSSLPASLITSSTAHFPFSAVVTLQFSRFSSPPTANSTRGSSSTSKTCGRDLETMRLCCVKDCDGFAGGAVLGTWSMSAVYHGRPLRKFDTVSPERDKWATGGGAGILSVTRVPTPCEELIAISPCIASTICLQR